MTAAEIARTGDMSALDTLDPASREVAVSLYLTHARDQLALAVLATGPEAVAALKAEIATAAEATKQLGLSKEIQADAQEMVRRAEYALGKAIRAGQENGTVRTHGQTVTRYAQAGLARGADREVQIPDITVAPSPTEFASMNELSGDRGNGIYAMTDGVSEPEFDAALADAKAEGNLSRANVVRKIKGVKNDRLTPVEKLTAIRKYADTGMTSGQIADEIGAGEPYVRNVARTNGITITADEVLRGTHRVRVDSNHIVNHAVMTLDGLVSGLDLIRFADLDVTQAENWATSLTNSLRALNRLNKQIKEMTQ